MWHVYLNDDYGVYVSEKDNLADIYVCKLLLDNEDDLDGVLGLLQVVIDVVMDQIALDLGNPLPVKKAVLPAKTNKKSNKKLN